MHGTSGHDRFQPTRWSLVRRAHDDGEPAEARAALGELIGAYWRPVYAFVRRKGHAPAQAQDLTQDFFARLLEGRGLAGADPRRGSFRAYLLGALKHHLVDAHRREGAARRGGGVAPLPLDLAAGDDMESVCPILPGDPATPEATFERRWAEQVLARALARLRAELEAEDRGVQFEVLRLTVDPDPPSYAEIAARLGIAVTDVTNYLHRARRRFRRALRAEVLPAVGGAGDLEDEIRDLLAALGSPRGLGDAQTDA